MKSPLPATAAWFPLKANDYRLTSFKFMPPPYPPTALQLEPTGTARTAIAADARLVEDASRRNPYSWQKTIDFARANGIRL